MPPLALEGSTLITSMDLHLFNEGSHNRLYEKLGAHLVTVDGQAGTYFAVWAPDAERISVVGDFNGWNPDSTPMQKTPDGAWLVLVELKHGHHRYAFVVDGQITLDPTAMGITRDDQGKRVSLIANS